MVIQETADSESRADQTGVAASGRGGVQDARRHAVVDADVHQLLGEDAILSYLSEGWREYVCDAVPRIPIVAGFNYYVPGGPNRHDATGHDGTSRTSASSVSEVQAQLLDGLGVDYAILTFGPELYLGSLANPYFASDIARACNDLVIDEWLPGDSRFRGSVLVANQLPELAAKEIHRVAGKPGFVQTILTSNGLGHPFGHPIFDPIHRATAEAGLALTIHSGGDAGGTMAEPTGGGRATYYIEYSTGVAQGIMTHIMSFIYNGVFERYSDLRVVVLEAGVGWLPWFLRRMDENYRSVARREIPWCKKLPSEYFRTHIRVGTQPLDIASPRDKMWELLDEFGIADTCIFASDYPHWDTDEPRYIQGRLPTEWRAKVLWENAAKLYGLTTETK